MYISTPAEARNGPSYARVPNLSGTGRVLLVSGLHAESSEGATDAALSPELISLASRAAPGSAFDPSQNFEFLLELRSVDGTVREWKLIAARFDR